MRKLLIIALFLLPTLLLAQTASIRGFVYDDETGEVVPFANVQLKDTKYGAATDVNGFFIINKAPPGTYTIRISYIGYEDYAETVVLEKDRTITKKINIKPKAISLQGVEISAERQEYKTQTQVSIEKITAKQIKQMPSIGGQGDLAQYLQVLPGIIFTGDQGGQLFIRGGSLVQNKVLMDGMLIYNPFHSIGLFSVFETDAILSADIYTGGYGAEYGGRISSVMDIRTRDGNKKRFSGKLGLSTFGGNLILEGPLKKETPQSGNSISFLIASKGSYLSQTSKNIYSYIDGGLPYDFFDVYGKLSFLGSNGSKFNVFGFNFLDNVDSYKSIADYHWNNYGLGMNFVAIPGTNALVEGLVAYSNYKVTLQDGQSTTPKMSQISGVTAGLYMSYFYGRNRLKYGFEVQAFSTDYSFLSNTKNFIEQQGNTSESSAFMTYKWLIGDKLILEPGLRFIYYGGSLSESSLEPRFAGKWLITNRFRFKLAAGLYSQSILDTKSDRDIVNLFTGFLTGSSNLNITKNFKGEEISGYLQRSQHIVAGFEYDIMKYLMLNIEGYYKHFPQLINLNRNKLYDNLAEYREGGAFPKPEYLRTDFIIETGDAYGIDLSAKYDYNRFYVWVAYSFGFVTRENEIEEYHPYYDRRHNLNVLFSYSWGKVQDWEANFRWNYGSGFPFTQTKGAYEALSFQDGINDNYLIDNGTLGIEYAGLNEGRLPHYHRLDLMLKKKFSTGKRSILEVNISITNAYNRANMFYFDRVLYERVDQLPFMPSIGLLWSF